MPASASQSTDIRHIPVEIVREILIWALPGPPQALGIVDDLNDIVLCSPTNNSHLRSAMIIRRVCRLWDFITTELRYIWSYVVLTQRSVQDAYQIFDTILERSKSLPIWLTIRDIDVAPGGTTDLTRRLDQISHRLAVVVLSGSVKLSYDYVLELPREDLALLVRRQPVSADLCIRASPRTLFLPTPLDFWKTSIRVSSVQHVHLGLAYFSDLAALLRDAPTLKSCCVDMFTFPSALTRPPLENNQLEYLSVRFIPSLIPTDFFDFEGLKRLRRLKLNNTLFPTSGVSYVPDSAPTLQEIHVNYHCSELDQALSTSPNLRHLVISQTCPISWYTNPPLPHFFLHLEHITIVHPFSSTLLSGTLVFGQIIPFLDLPRLLLIDLDIQCTFVTHKIASGSTQFKDIEYLLLDTDLSVVKSIRSALKRGVTILVNGFPVMEWLPSSSYVITT